MCRNVGLAEMHALKHFSTVRKSAPSPHGINGAQGSVSSPMRIFLGMYFWIWGHIAGRKKIFAEKARFSSQADDNGKQFIRHTLD
jgi:hypothetical protein